MTLSYEYLLNIKTHMDNSEKWLPICEQAYGEILTAKLPSRNTKKKKLLVYLIKKFRKQPCFKRYEHIFPLTENQKLAIKEVGEIK